MKDQTIAIHESKNSEKVIIFCRGYHQLLQYCSKRQAKRILKASENGSLWGVYFDKNRKARATYI